MKIKLLILFLLAALGGKCQDKDEKKIVKILDVQTGAWNRGDVEGFMQTYWKNDSLLFIGKSGVSRGWTSALNHYKKNYPDTAAMGQLSFNIIQVKKLSGKYAYVVGKWTLIRTIGNLTGHFDLLMRKIKGRWLIISDHSS